MDTLKLKNETMMMALGRLRDAIRYFNMTILTQKEYFPAEMEPDEIKRSLRDSLIQRFEFCTDLFWKYIKKYLEEKLQLAPELNAPRPVIISACKAGIFSEDDAEMLLEMIKSRNLSSLIYKEEIADQISTKIPKYYDIMYKYVHGLTIT